MLVPVSTIPSTPCFYLGKMQSEACPWAHLNSMEIGIWLQIFTPCCPAVTPPSLSFPAILLPSVPSLPGSKLQLSNHTPNPSQTTSTDRGAHPGLNVNVNNAKNSFQLNTFQAALPGEVSFGWQRQMADAKMSVPPAAWAVTLCCQAAEKVTGWELVASTCASASSKAKVNTKVIRAESTAEAELCLSDIFIISYRVCRQGCWLGNWK